MGRIMPRRTCPRPHPRELLQAKGISRVKFSYGPQSAEFILDYRGGSNLITQILKIYGDPFSAEVTGM